MPQLTGLIMMTVLLALFFEFHHQSLECQFITRALSANSQIFSAPEVLVQLDDASIRAYCLHRVVMQNALDAKVERVVHFDRTIDNAFEGLVRVPQVTHEISPAEMFKPEEQRDDVASVCTAYLFEFAWDAPKPS